MALSAPLLGLSIQQHSVYPRYGIGICGGPKGVRTGAVTADRVLKQGQILKVDCNAEQR